MNMKRLLVFAMLVAVLVAAPAFAADALRAAQGAVRSVDLQSRTLTLVNGRTFAIPANISGVNLKEGQQVTVTYQDGSDGRPVMEAFWIDASPAGDVDR